MKLQLDKRVLEEVMATAPVLVTMANVPILEAGVEYELSTGPATFTPEDLRDAVTAANEDPSIPLPRLKLGHIDPRYNSEEYDGDPAFGKATNLRLSSNGMVVLADYVGVPKWLADIMPVAYPSRSIEGYRNVESQGGGKWRLVLSAVAALGIKWPGITQLEDLQLYYGEEIPDGVEIDAELIAAATKEEGNAMKTEVNAAANLDDIRRAFYAEYVNNPENSGANWWWVRAVMTDPNQLVVEDEESGQLFLLAFSSDAKGTVSFGEAEPVRIDYVPDEQKKEAAQYVAATLTLGHQVLASWSSREESLPESESENDNEQGGTMDRTEAIKRLGLPDDATDEAILAHLTAVDEIVSVLRPAGTTEGQQGSNDGGGEEGEIVPTKPSELTIEQLAAAAKGVTAHLPPVEDGKPLVQIDKENYERLLAGVRLGEAAYEQLKERETELLLDEALTAGKFPPSRRDAWAKYLHADPVGAKAALKELEAGLIPVNEMGGHGGSDEAGPAIQYPLELFPEIAKRRQREALVNAGAASPSRIQTDGSMRRGGGLGAR